MRFSVASYNILADSYIQPRWYPGTPAEMLAPGYRRPALVRRVADLHADVVCLQEIEPAVYQAVETDLAPRGYRGWYAAKAGKPDGCATFVRDSLFVVEEAGRSFHYADGNGTRPHTGHGALILVVRQEGRRLGLANTHLKFDRPGTPRSEQWGYRQAVQLLEHRDRVAPPCEAWVLCGDLNALPDSDVLETLKGGGFLDAYAGLPGQYTCNSNQRAKRIDYLLYTAALECRPVELPPLDDGTPLPSVLEPSDHLPIRAEFGWKRPAAPPGE